MARVALYVVAVALALSGLYLALTATPPGTGDEGADTAAPPLSTTNRRASPSRRRDASFLRYDLENKTMTLRLSIRAGAAVGAPPSEPGRWMYSVLQARWVRRAAPVAPPKTLLTEPRVCEGVLAAYCL